MNVGEHTQLVEEVMDFVRSNRLFNKENVHVSNAMIIRDFSEAQNRAWSQESNEAGTVWEYVKAKEAESIVEKIYRSGLTAQQEELYDFFSDHAQYSNDFLPFEYSDIKEEVEGDLTMCALNRLINGKTDHFYEKIFEFYKHGGWPCGWEGMYPQGKMIVYVP